MLPRLERQNTTKKENLFMQNCNDQTLENIILEHLDLHVCMHT